MRVLKVSELREWEQYTIQNEPVSESDLMERAAWACYLKLSEILESQFIYKENATVLVVCGQGNNGGDGLVIARHLAAYQWKVAVGVLQTKTKGSACFEEKKQALQDAGISIQYLDTDEKLSALSNSDVYIDALYGTGLNQNLQGLSASLIQLLNQREGLKISIDIPSGLHGDIELAIERTDAITFNAHHTICIEMPKTALLFPETGNVAGTLHTVPLALHSAFKFSADSNYFYTDSDPGNSANQNKFRHKGSRGHALLVGGSFGKMGAILLSSKAAIATGCGLTTAYLPKAGYTILQTALPEAMLICDDMPAEIHHLPDTQNFSALGIGPGMGRHPATVMAFKNWIGHINTPMVIDADALNACAEILHTTPDFTFPQNAILTPHPGEFDRLFGKHNNSYGRLQTALKMSAQYQVVIVVKGAHSAVVLPNGEIHFNGSGNALLATGGSGDVLTGIITSLLAQGYTPEKAAMRGVYLHGAAADLLEQDGYSTLLASQLTEAIQFIV